MGDHWQPGLRRLEAADAGHRRGGSQPHRRPRDGRPRPCRRQRRRSSVGGGRRSGLLCHRLAGQPRRTRATRRHRGTANGRRRLRRFADVGVHRRVPGGDRGVVSGVRNAVGAGKPCGPRRGCRQRPDRRCAAGRAVGDVCRATHDLDDRRRLCAGSIDRRLAAATLAHAERCIGVGLSVPGCRRPPHRRGSRLPAGGSPTDLAPGCVR